MKILKFLDDHLEEVLMSIFLVMIIVMMTAQVIMRYVFNNALSFPEEVSRYSFIWMCYLGVSYAVKKGGILKVDILTTLFPKLQKPLDIFGDVLYAAFCALMIVPGFQTVTSIMENGSTSAAIGLPMWIVYLSFLIGAILTVIRTIEKYISLFRGKKENQIEEGGAN